MRILAWHTLNAAEQRDALQRPAQRDAVRVAPQAAPLSVMGLGYRSREQLRERPAGQLAPRVAEDGRGQNIREDDRALTA